MAKKRKSRAKFTTRQKEAIKGIRSSLAILKRKKIIAKTVEVRKALPTKATRALVRKHKAVVTGAATSYKIPKDIPKETLAALKELGYKPVGRGENRRIVVPTSQYYRKGKIYERPTKSRGGYGIIRITLTPDEIERQVNAAFKNLKPGDQVAFEVGDVGGIGGRSYNIYSSPESMLAELMAYQERGFKFTHLAVFKVTQAKQPAYVAETKRRTDERVYGTPAYREAKRAASKAFYASLSRSERHDRYIKYKNKGLRTSRGH